MSVDVPVIDAHTHIFLPEVVERRAHYCDRDRWFGELYAAEQALLASPEQLIASMDAAGIGHSIVCGFPWADPGHCRAHTAWMAEVCRQFPARLSFLGIVAPLSPEAVRDAERAFDLGAVGLGEFNADAQGFDLLDPSAIVPLMGVCAERGKPIMLHASEPVGHFYPGKGRATPDRIVTFLTAFPTQPVVLAHWGGGLPFYELMPEVRAVTHFVSYDSAATTYLYNSAVFPTVIGLVGPDRALFASDYPVLRQDRLLRRVTRVVEDEQMRGKLLATNATRVYGITAIGSETPG